MPWALERERPLEPSVPNAHKEYQPCDIAEIIKTEFDQDDKLSGLLG
jgi:hypothetical protein